MRKLPVGIQSFEKTRKNDFLYVDKTEYIFQLVHQEVPCFLSRPRRFGKSLLLSAMKAYWEGKKDLFHGLAIETLEAGNPEAWKKYPVLYFDFNGEDYKKEQKLEERIEEHLVRWEKQYGIARAEGTLGARFRTVIRKANEETGLRCVVLVDEYDKPLLEVMDSPELEEYNKAVFKGFFSTLKEYDDYLQFVFITGVTKFEKVSIFSDLNQLRDISMSLDYAGLCGITEEELNGCFQEELEELARAQQMTLQECRNELKSMYDGYRFHPQGPFVYNPLSLLTAFTEREFGSYWFATGTPAFLVKRICQSHFDVRKFTDETLYASEGALSDYRADTPDLLPLLYQAGYLTIAAYDRRRKRYTLTFPNGEVKYGMLENLLPAYAGVNRGAGIDIYSFENCIEEGDTDGMRNILTALFARIPYAGKDAPFEYNFQSVLYVLFELLGQFVTCELHTANGRIDCIVETDRFVYLFEFKRDESAEAALKQIEDNGYALAYTADPRMLYKIGVNFDSEKRILEDWKVEQ